MLFFEWDAGMAPLCAAVEFVWGEEFAYLLCGCKEESSDQVDPQPSHFYLNLYFYFNFF